MTASNLAKVFGPTIVQNSSSDLEPMQMLQEAKWQPKVGSVRKRNAPQYELLWKQPGTYTYNYFPQKKFCTANAAKKKVSCKESYSERDWAGAF